MPNLGNPLAFTAAGQSPAYSASPSVTSLLLGYTTTATAAGTTTITSSSNQNQFFSGSTTQTVLLPVTSTLTLGQQYNIVNNSSGVVTVQSSGANTIQAMAANTELALFCISLSGTGAASWTSRYVTTTPTTLPLSLANGGTAATLTASNGGIFYSTASAGAILSGTATAQQLLMSGASTTPVWSTTTYPATNAINTIMYASSANVMAALATANNSLLLTSSGGVPSFGSVGSNITISSSKISAVPRSSSTASITSPLAPNSDNFDMYIATAQAGALTINADTGSPVDGQKLLFRFLDNATPRALTWASGSSKTYQAVGITLPTTTTASKITYVGFVYNANAARWDGVATGTQA